MLPFSCFIRFSDTAISFNFVFEIKLYYATQDGMHRHVSAHHLAVSSPSSQSRKMSMLCMWSTISEMQILVAGFGSSMRRSMTVAASSSRSSAMRLLMCCAVLSPLLRAGGNSYVAPLWAGMSSRDSAGSSSRMGLKEDKVPTSAFIVCASCPDAKL